MLICENCGEHFQEPVMKTEYTGVSCDGFHETIRYGVCPYCGSDDIEDAHECMICGEWTSGDYCDECHETIANDLSALISQLLWESECSGKEATKLDAAWVIGDVLERDY